MRRSSLIIALAAATSLAVTAPAKAQNNDALGAAIVLGGMALIGGIAIGSTMNNNYGPRYYVAPPPIMVGPPVAVMPYGHHHHHRGYDPDHCWRTHQCNGQNDW